MLEIHFITSYIVFYEADCERGKMETLYHTHENMFLM